MAKIHSDKAPISGMDVIIVSTNTPRREEFWHKRLKTLRGVICKPDAIVITVCEEWPGGAGNGLGTLYAYTKAQEKAKFKYQIDLFEMQKKGASVAIYHTAGQGKRLFPLTASEYNDKSSVKLPGLLDNNQLSILEAVIAQTNHFGEQRKGRLSVFWGDQIFVPSKGGLQEGTHHIEILGRGLEIPSNEEWLKKGYGNYGLLSILNNGQTTLLEKIHYETLMELTSSAPYSDLSGIATSLGSFSLSPQFTFALLREYEKEVHRQHGKLDTDPHFWMPLTLNSETYLKLMAMKGCSSNEAYSHYQRMEAFKQKFFSLHSEKDFFRFVDIGPHGYWWDYGSIGSYYSSFLKLASQNNEGQAMRQFYQLVKRGIEGDGNRLIKDANSCLINCNISSGKVVNSILIGVNAVSVEAKNCVIINSDFQSLKGSYSLFYNVNEPKDVKFSPGTIRADITLPKSKERLVLYTHQGRNSKDDWNTKLPQNALSFNEAYEKIRQELHG